MADEGPPAFAAPHLVAEACARALAAEKAAAAGPSQGANSQPRQRAIGSTPKSPPSQNPGGAGPGGLMCGLLYLSSCAPVNSGGGRDAVFWAGL